MIKRIIYDLFRWVKKKEFLFMLFNKLYLPKEDNNIIPQKNYDLSVYAYPSSANTYFYHYIRNLLSDNLKISHHTHAPSMISRSLRYNIPIIIIIRNPLDAITSYYTRFSAGKTFSINTAVRAYIDFYKVVQKNINSLHIIKFEDAINNPYSESIKVLKENSIQVTDSMSKSDLAEHDEYVKSYIVSDKMSSSFSTSVLPDDKKEMLKIDVYPKVKKNKHFLKAQKLYDEIINDNNEK